jgi:hypothetical protein
MQKSGVPAGCRAGGEFCIRRKVFMVLYWNWAAYGGFSDGTMRAAMMLHTMSFPALCRYGSEISYLASKFFEVGWPHRIEKAGFDGDGLAVDCGDYDLEPVDIEVEFLLHHLSVVIYSMSAEDNGALVARRVEMGERFGQELFGFSGADERCLTKLEVVGISEAFLSVDEMSVWPDTHVVVHHLA